MKRPFPDLPFPIWVLMFIGLVIMPFYVIALYVDEVCSDFWHGRSKRQRYDDVFRQQKNQSPL